MTTGVIKRNEGSVLLVTIATIAIIAIAMTSYLAVVSNQNRSVARATAWNQAIPVLEGGIEEALTQIHYQGTNNLSANGWTLGTDNYYHKTRAFSDGNYYSATIIPTNPPSIISTGYVVVPFNGTSPTQYVSRRVRVTTRNPNAGGLVAKGNITMSGNNTFVDSYDSSNPSHSTTNGTYNPATRETNVTVLTDTGNINATTIYGNAVTGPSGTVSGTVKGTVTHNANVQFNDVPQPFPPGTGLAPDTGILGLGTLIGLTNYAYVLRDGSYSMTGLSMSGGAMYVSGNPSTLFINGSVSLSGGYVYVAPGASLLMYLNGTADLSGGGMINGTGPATNVYIYGMTNCTQIKMSGSSAVDAVVYAPDADVAYSGNADFSGAITGNTIKLSGNGSFHYDQAIADTGFVVVSWNEF